jgi:zinc/manganese transport system substrate-binding protein
MHRFRGRLFGGVLVLAALVGSACGTSSSSTKSSSGKVAVVAAEDFWGSIASQLGGDRVTLTSLITNPDTDPHSYEPTPGDGRAIASARSFIANGIGYDPWADKLLSANPAQGRTVLKVGDLAGLKEGDNPHQWYSPPVVERVVAQTTSATPLKPAAWLSTSPSSPTSRRSTRVRRWERPRASSPRWPRRWGCSW